METKAITGRVASLGKQDSYQTSKHRALSLFHVLKEHMEPDQGEAFMHDEDRFDYARAQVLAVVLIHLLFLLDTNIHI